MHFANAQLGIDLIGMTNAIHATQLFIKRVLISAWNQWNVKMHFMHLHNTYKGKLSARFMKGQKQLCGMRKIQQWSDKAILVAQIAEECERMFKYAIIVLSSTTISIYNIHSFTSIQQLAPEWHNRLHKLNATMPTVENSIRWNVHAGQVQCTRFFSKLTNWAVLWYSANSSVSVVLCQYLYAIFNAARLCGSDGNNVNIQSNIIKSKIIIAFDMQFHLCTYEMVICIQIECERN